MAGKKPRISVSRTGSRSRRAIWFWVAGLAVVGIIVVWQVAHGVFVQRLNVPGVADVSFTTNAGNKVEAIGEGNRSAVNGTDNTVLQRGTGNTAIIGGAPVDWGKEREQSAERPPADQRRSGQIPRPDPRPQAGSPGPGMDETTGSETESLRARIRRDTEKEFERMEREVDQR